MFYAANISQSELEARYSPGTVRRLGSNALVAKETVERTLQQDKDSDITKNGRATFVAVDQNEKDGSSSAVGIGTVMAGLKLYVHHIPLQPFITDRIPSHRIRTEALYGHANVTGWTMPEYYNELDGVYSRLLGEVPEPYNSWTIEPVRSHAAVHEAIRRAGLIALGSPERYDVGEDRNVLPPVSQAYSSLRKG